MGNRRCEWYRVGGAAASAFEPGAAGVPGPLVSKKRWAWSRGAIESSRPHLRAWPRGEPREKDDGNLKCAKMCHCSQIIKLNFKKRWVAVQKWLIGRLFDNHFNIVSFLIQYNFLALILCSGFLSIQSRSLNRESSGASFLSRLSYFPD